MRLAKPLFADPQDKVKVRQRLDGVAELEQAACQIIRTDQRFRVRRAESPLAAFQCAAKQRQRVGSLPQ